MKKMLFSAIAMVAFVGSSFASNEVVEINYSTEINYQVNSVENNSMYISPAIIEMFQKCAPCFSAVGAVDSKFSEWGVEDQDFRDDIKAKVWQDCTNTIDG